MSSIIYYPVQIAQSTVSTAPPKSGPDQPGPHAAGCAARSLAAVEQETGLSKHTLLDWERRFGFPAPQRDASGQRQYPADQVERLHLVKHLLEAGHTVDRLVSMAPEEVARLAATAGRIAAADDAQAADGPGLRRAAIVERVASTDVAGLRGGLTQALADLGLDRFVRELVAPLNGDIGDAWMQGRLELFQEHLYTETVQGVLRHALQGLPDRRPGRPLVLLTTTSDERHGLGLLMAQAVLQLEGCHCVSLGVQTPVWDIARAATSIGADVVALSHSGAADPSRVTETLGELRSKLPRAVELWVGGSAAVLRRQTVEGVRVMTQLEHAVTAVAAWRTRHPAAA